MIGLFKTQLKSDRSRALLQQFCSLRAKVLLRLKQWTTGVAISSIMSMFTKKEKKSSRQQTRFQILSTANKGFEVQKRKT